jgi:GNAT superfamily N-acetyltransferase
VIIGVAGPEDRDTIDAMFRRCSPATLQRRFHAPAAHPPARYLDWVLQAPSAAHLALVARTGDHVIGLAEAHRGRDGVAEVAVVVEDTWQRRGVGTELFRALLRSERQLGATRVRATVLTEHAWLPRRLLLVDGARATTAGTTSEILVPIRPRHRRARRRHDDARARRPATATVG